MFVLKVALLVFVLAFSITDVYCLTCRCAEDICNGNVTVCEADEVCYAAEIRLQDKTIKLKKGCKPKDECGNVGHCPDSEPGSECAKYGCCNYDRCVVNYTLGKDFETPSPTPTPTIGLAPTSTIGLAPTSTIGLAPTSTMKAPMVSSSDVLEAMSSVVPMATKETRAPSPAARATSSLAAKMSSKPVILATENKMSVTGPPQPMTSAAQPEVMPTGSMAKMAKSSLVKEMKPTTKPTSLTSAGVLSSNVLNEKGKMDKRPPCDASGRMLSLGTFVLTAIGLLCILM